MPSSTQTRVIRVKADVSGSKDLKQIADYMAKLNGEVKSLSGSFGFLKNAFLGYLSLNGLRQLTQVSDSMQNLNNRLITITGSQEAATQTMQALLRVANETNGSISATAESYSRLGVALKGTGASQEGILQLTKVLTNSFRLSGSTVTETTNTIIQLSQAFASGQLRGQELRSVMEQNAVVAEVLRKRFGTDIYKKAADGAISVTEVLKALTENMETINKQALLLTPTFEQTLTKAFNGFKVALLQVNQEFNLSGNFAKMVDFLLEKLPVIGALVGVLALTQLPAMAAALASVGKSLFALNTYAGVFAVLGTTAVILIDQFYGLDRAGKLVTKALASIAFVTQSINAEIYKLLAAFGGGNNPFTNFNAAAKEFEGNAQNLKAFIADLGKELSAPRKTGTNYIIDQVAMSSAAAKKQMEELTKAAAKYYKDIEGKAPKAKELLAQLNNEYLKVTISATEYSSALIEFNFKRLNMEFEQGKINLDAFNKGLQELNRQDINRAFSYGAISINQFNQAISQSKLKDLKTDLDSGKISLIEYRSEFAKISEEFSIKGSFQAGAANYITSIGTVGQQTAQAIQNAFSGLETVFSDFIKKGKFNFSDFTRSVLDDLTKIIIRASIIRPLAGAILDSGQTDYTVNSGTIGGTRAFDSINASGNAYDRGNVIPFARGGVVGSPTTFGMSKGRTGLMGEAGPEAILPLARGSGGKLGVQAQVNPVTVNIINQAGVDVQQQETTGPSGERILEVIIAQKVKEQFANGTYDKTLRTQYGLSRKGQ